MVCPGEDSGVKKTIALEVPFNNEFFYDIVKGDWVQMCLKVSADGKDIQSQPRH